MCRFLTAAILWLAFAGAALAQGCGPQNPNCIVPTAPFGTSNNQAASTAFVQVATAAAGLTVNLSPIVGGAANGILYDRGGTVGEIATGNSSIFVTSSGG